MANTEGYAAFGAESALRPFSFDRREMGPQDVQIRIEYCGVCHSDMHMAHNDWGRSVYPFVPGHEIIGRVTALGDQVKGFSIGELVGVGCMVDSCRTCDACKQHLEPFCPQVVMTYSSTDPKYPDAVTQGGYSSHIVVDKDFVLHVSETLDTAAVAPLLCAGITMYSPLRHWQVSPGQTVGIIGLGGLGHMGVKLAKAMGARVVMITSSEKKAADAKQLGADVAIISTNEADMAAWQGQFDLLVNTIPVAHDVNPYLGLLKIDKTMVIVGGTPIELHSMGLIFGRKRIAGSLIGGIKETQEMLDFCAEHQIVPLVEHIALEDINTAYERLAVGDVRYRFVIDMAKS